MIIFFSPWHNSTAVLVDEDLYSGTVADFTGVDPIIFKKPLRTQQYDSTQLNSPDFVGSFPHKDFVYFFLREGKIFSIQHRNFNSGIKVKIQRYHSNHLTIAIFFSPLREKSRQFE